VELAPYLLKAANDILCEQGIDGLPKQLAGSPFWLAAAQDKSVMAFGALEFDGHVYKIGTKRLDNSP
jgi:hypothetical protein